MEKGRKKLENYAERLQQIRVKYCKKIDGGSVVDSQRSIDLSKPQSKYNRKASQLYNPQRQPPFEPLTYREGRNGQFDTFKAKNEQKSSRPLMNKETNIGHINTQQTASKTYKKIDLINEYRCRIKSTFPKPTNYQLQNRPMPTTNLTQSKPKSIPKPSLHCDSSFDSPIKLVTCDSTQHRSSLYSQWQPSSRTNHIDKISQFDMSGIDKLQRKIQTALGHYH